MEALAPLQPILQRLYAVTQVVQLLVNSAEALVYGHVFSPSLA